MVSLLYACYYLKQIKDESFSHEECVSERFFKRQYNVFLGKSMLRK